MQLTIHTHHELSDEAKQIIQGFAQAHMRDDIDQASVLEDDLEQLGFLIAKKRLNFEAEQVEVYISKKASITLSIQLVSKPEMTAQEATGFISDDFPQDEGGEFIISCDSRAGIVHLKINQDKLTDEQRDWLHLSTFAARYVDSYTVQKGE